MFLLGIFSGVFLCRVGLRLCLYHFFWIIYSRWLINRSTGQEGPLIFLLKVWSHLLGGMGFYITNSPESVYERFSDMNNPTRDEPMHKNVMAKVIEDTNQGTTALGDSCAFPFFGNVGAIFMATLNILELNVGLPVWLWTTMNALNSLDASHIRTLCHGHRMDADPLPYELAKSTSPPCPSSGESPTTSN
jgi:hypothetical protein